MADDTGTSTLAEAVRRAACPLTGSASDHDPLLDLVGNAQSERLKEIGGVDITVAGARRTWTSEKDITVRLSPRAISKMHTPVRFLVMPTSTGVITVGITVYDALDDHPDIPDVERRGPRILYAGTGDAMTDDRMEQYRKAAERTAEEQRKIQEQMDRRDRQRQEKGGETRQQGAVQAGTRVQPENPFPQQHLEKPGIESQLTPRPRFLAPDYKGSEKLKDMVALITGGDSGIGRAVATLFAREGADVAVVYLSEHGDAEETKRVVEQEGRRCLLISGDVKDPRFCQDAVEHTVAELGKLDILVNNAAFQEHAMSLEELSEEHFDQTIRTNLYGYFHMAKAALPYLKSGSAIINSGSETGLFGSPALLDYSATKGAIHAFTKSLAVNLVEKGIRVNAVAPGPVWTPLNPADKPAEQVAQFGHGSPMKRPAQPEEIAPAYVYLAAPVCSSYVTGIVLPVTGGVTEGA